MTKFLADQHITANDQGEVVLNGKPIAHSNFKRIVKNLSNGRHKKSVGYDQVICHISKGDIPYGMFTNSIMQDVIRCKPAGKVLIAKTVNDDDSDIQWEVYD